MAADIIFLMPVLSPRQFIAVFLYKINAVEAAFCILKMGMFRTFDKQMLKKVFPAEKFTAFNVF